MSQQTDEIREQIMALEDIADRLGEIRQELRRLGISDPRLENYVIPALSDLVRGEGYNKYNTSLYDLIESLEVQTVDFETFKATMEKAGVTKDLVDFFNDFRENYTDLQEYVSLVAEHNSEYGE